jgi:hypothetical protein
MDALYLDLCVHTGRCRFVFRGSLELAATGQRHMKAAVRWPSARNRRSTCAQLPPHYLNPTARHDASAKNVASLHTKWSYRRRAQCVGRGIGPASIKPAALSPVARSPKPRTKTTHHTTEEEAPPTSQPAVSKKKRDGVDSVRCCRFKKKNARARGRVGWGGVGGLGLGVERVAQQLRGGGGGSCCGVVCAARRRRQRAAAGGRCQERGVDGPSSSDPRARACACFWVWEMNCVLVWRSLSRTRIARSPSYYPQTQPKKTTSHIANFTPRISHTSRSSPPAEQAAEQPAALGLVLSHGRFLGAAELGRAADLCFCVVGGVGGGVVFARRVWRHGRACGACLASVCLNDNSTPTHSIDPLFANAPFRSPPSEFPPSGCPASGFPPLKFPPSKFPPFGCPPSEFPPFGR